MCVYYTVIDENLVESNKLSSSRFGSAFVVRDSVFEAQSSRLCVYGSAFEAFETQCSRLSTRGLAFQT